MRIGGVDGLTLSVQAGFGYRFADTITWTDITTLVRGFACQRGREQNTDRYNAGSAVLTLDNTDRRFDPSYSGGPYGTNVKPMVPVRIRVTRNAVTYPVFYGYADAWVPRTTAAVRGEAIVELRCTDAFKVLAMARAPDSVYGYEVDGDTPAAWYRMDETSGTQMHDRSGGGYHGDYLNGAVFNHRAGPVGGAIEFTGDYAASVVPTPIDDSTFTIEMVLVSEHVSAARSAILMQRADPSPSKVASLLVEEDVGRLRFKITDASSNTSTLTTNVQIMDGRPHHVALTRSSSTLNIYVDGVDVPVADDSVGTIGTFTGWGSELRVAPYLLAAEYDERWVGTIDEIAYYTSVLDAATVAAHAAAVHTPWSGDSTGTRVGRLLDLAAWPAGLRDLDTGVSTLTDARLDSRPVLDLLRDVETAERGRLFVARDGVVTYQSRIAEHVDATATTSQATFGFSGADIAYGAVEFDYSDELVFNRCVVAMSSRRRFESSDATSIAAYGERTLNLSVPDATDAFGQALADWEVARGKDPAVRITQLRIPTARDTATFDEAVGLELGYRITVNADPPGTGTFTDDLIVEGIAHESTPNGWVTTVWCSPAADYSLVIVGTSLVGDGSIVGY